MLNGTTVFVASIGYVCFLFAVAWWGDHAGRRFVVGRRRALVYALSLAVYCTSWTYYGSVGVASTHGLDFLPIYIGPILVVGFGHRLIARIADLARAQNLTTVADFVSARYGKSQGVAALAALIALIGLRSLYRAATQGDRPDHIDGRRLVRARSVDAGRAFVGLRSRGDLGAGGLRHGLRHAAHRPEGAPERADPGDCGRVGRQARRLFSPSAPLSSGGCSAAWRFGARRRNRRRIGDGIQSAPDPANG